MIRFILLRQHTFNGREFNAYETLDVDVPELEKALKRGGVDRGLREHDVTTLFDCEIREVP